MNKKQTENTAKLLYDLIKLTYIGLIITGIVQGQGFGSLPVVVGAIIAAIFYLIAYWLDREE